MENEVFCCFNFYICWMNTWSSGRAWSWWWIRWMLKGGFLSEHQSLELSSLSFSRFFSFVLLFGRNSLCSINSINFWFCFVNRRVRKSKKHADKSFSCSWWGENSPMLFMVMAQQTALCNSTRPKGPNAFVWQPWVMSTSQLPLSAAWEQTVKWDWPGVTFALNFHYLLPSPGGGSPLPAGICRQCLCNIW